jgi:hypothetical protein
MVKVLSRFTPSVADSYKFRKPGDTFEGYLLSYGHKPIKKELVPYICVATEGGEVYEILLSCYGLQNLYPTIQTGRVEKLGIRYEGESETIESAGNYLKLFSYWFEDKSGNSIFLVSEQETVRREIESCIPPQDIDDSQDRNEGVSEDNQETLDDLPFEREKAIQREPKKKTKR